MDTNPYESPAAAEATPVTKRRGVLGLITLSIVFAIGLALTARAAWIAVTWPDKSADEWNQIYKLGGLGLLQLLYASVRLFLRYRDRSLLGRNT
jgi:hypothetical protein